MESADSKGESVELTYNEKRLKVFSEIYKLIDKERSTLSVLSVEAIRNAPSDKNGSCMDSAKNQLFKVTILEDFSKKFLSLVNMYWPTEK